MQGQQNELAQRRSKVELELAEAGPAVEEAKAAVQGIKRQQLDEVSDLSLEEYTQVMRSWRVDKFRSFRRLEV